jgi:hypothetical protein
MFLTMALDTKDFDIICDSPLRLGEISEQTNKLYTIWGFHGGDYKECRFLRCDAVWLTDVSEDRIASIIRVRRISVLGTLAVTSN